MESLTPQHIELDLPDATIGYYPNFFTTAESNIYYTTIIQDTPWQQDQIKIFGKVHAQPRLTALYGDEGKTLSYSNIVMQPNPWTTLLLEIKQRVALICNADFNTVLLNYYRNGNDSNGWHADNEKYLGKNPVIASVTFGQERYFHLKHNALKIPMQKLLLQQGSVMIMAGTTQHFWKHQIPKTAKIVGPRINLTFRSVL